MNIAQMIDRCARIVQSRPRMRSAETSCHWHLLNLLGMIWGRSRSQNLRHDKNIIR